MKKSKWVLGWIGAVALLMSFAGPAVAADDLISTADAALYRAKTQGGGVEVATGRIIDGHHPLRGRSVAGRIPAILSGRGPDPADFGISPVPHPGHHPRNRDR